MPRSSMRIAKLWGIRHVRALWMIHKYYSRAFRLYGSDVSVEKLKEVTECHRRAARRVWDGLD